MWLIATSTSFSNGLTKAASAAGVQTPPGSAIVIVSLAKARANGTAHAASPAVVPASSSRRPIA